MRRTTGLALLVLFTLAAGPGWAEEGCRDDQTVEECVRDHLVATEDSGTTAEAKAKALDAKTRTDGAKQATEKAEKTPVADQSPGAASAVRDFLPFFFTSLGLGTASSDDEALTLTLNPKWLKGENAQGSLEARLYTPEPLEKLVMAAPESDREAVESGIEDELDDFDDVEVSATYTYRSENWGRDFKFHATRAATFLEQLVEAEKKAEERAGGKSEIQRLLDFLEELRQEEFAELFPEPVAEDPCESQCAVACAVVAAQAATARSGEESSEISGERTEAGSCEERCVAEVCAARAEAEAPSAEEQKDLVDQTFGELRSRNRTEADRLESRIVAAGEELIASRKRRVDLFAESNYFRFGDLVNNQPQLTASLKLRERDDLVGQRKITFNFTFEGGTVNVNRFEKWCKKKQRDVNSLCLADYWDAKGGNFDHLPRYKISLAVEHLGDLDTSFTLPADDPMTEGAMTAAADPVSLMLASSEKAVLTAAFGGFLMVDEDGNQLSRFDLEGKYEYVSDDDVRNERYLATATYTQRLTDTVSASIGMVYASDPEFRGAVDEEFSARAGLRFKIDRKEEKESDG